MTRRAANAIVTFVSTGQLQKREQSPSLKFVDAVHALSNDPTDANVARYLAESAALERHRSERTPSERTAHARRLP
jgi:hypothetical protein